MHSPIKPAINMYNGGCLCGKVRYEISGRIEDIVYCHCSLCRKAQGSAFAANGNIHISHFQFISGEDQLTEYKASAEHSKFFCQHCGSPIISTHTSQPTNIRVRIGSIESDITEKPVAHIFTASKANWENICGDIPQYKAHHNSNKK